MALTFTSTLICLITLLALGCIYFYLLDLQRLHSPWLLMQSTPPPGEEHPEMVDKDVLSICNLNVTSFCPQRDGPDTWDPDSACVAMASTGWGKEVACEEPNACSFARTIDDKYLQIYVSYKVKSSKAKASSIMYKICPNGLLIYSLE